jgi:hypothetical protein
MRVRRSASAAAVLWVGAAITPWSATALAAARPAAPHPANQPQSRLPAAARGPIAAALARDNATATITGLRQSHLTVTDSATDAQYGNAVAVSGNTIVVGARQHTVKSQLEQGAVYVFTRPASGWRNLKQTAELTASDGLAEDLFGYSVAIAGNTIVVGAPQHRVDDNADEGAAYLFTKPAKGWKTTSHSTSELTSSDGVVGDSFGSAVAVSGNTIVVGAPDKGVNSNAEQGEAYVFVKPKSGWPKTGHETTSLLAPDGGSLSEFGAGAAISGNTVVVGAPGGTAGGEAYVVVKPSGGWTSALQTRALAGSDADTDDGFGNSVAVSGDTVAIGSPSHGGGDQGAVYVFKQPALGWGPYADGVLNQTAELTVAGEPAGDGLGDSVAISGSVIVAGAEDHSSGTGVRQGAGYAFVKGGAKWRTGLQPAKTFVASGASSNAALGGSVAMDGDTIALGAEGQDGYTGAAYVFAPPGPSLSKVKQSHKTWVLGRKPAAVNPAHKPSGGTEFSFSVNETATVSLTFTEKVNGHSKTVGTLRAHAKSGKNTVWFDGVIGHGKKLRTGQSAVTISAATANGTVQAKPLTFTTHPKK